MPSPVAQYALDRGFPSDLIFTPERAGEVIFSLSAPVLVWFGRVRTLISPYVKSKAA